MDAAAALARDENNWPKREEIDGKLDDFPALDDRINGGESPPGFPESIGCVLVVSTDEPDECASIIWLPSWCGDDGMGEDVWCKWWKVRW